MHSEFIWQGVVSVTVAKTVCNIHFHCTQFNFLLTGGLSCASKAIPFVQLNWKSGNDQFCKSAEETWETSHFS